MKSHSGIIALVLAIMIPLIIGTVIIVRSQNTASDNPKTQQFQQDNKDVPVANYYEQLPADFVERARREKINKGRNPKFKDPGAEKRLKITEASESLYGGVPFDLVNPAIPAKKSAAIVISQVVGAKAYMTENKTSVYSEFEIEDTEFLKNTTSEKVGQKFFINRSGGGIKFPSGKIIYRYVRGRGMPQPGHKYVLFLDYSADRGFSVITGYELTDNGVLPLDGITPSGQTVSQLSGMLSFKGTAEADFINQVKDAIKKNENILHKEGTK